jgi:antitoxin component of MazEF toxin-antitoxin module
MKRQIKLHGNSFVIKLEPADMKDFKLKEGMFVDIVLGKIKDGDTDKQVKQLLEQIDFILNELKLLKNKI